MHTRWKVVLDQLSLAWAPVLALWLGTVVLMEPFLSMRLAIAVPAALIPATAAALVLYVSEHDTIPWFDSIGKLESVAIIVALVGLFVGGLYLNAAVTTLVIYAAILGQAVGVTLYRLCFGIIRPLPQPKTGTNG